MMLYTMLVSALMLTSAMAAQAAGKTRVADARSSRPAPPQGDPVLGKEKADAERCMECHGVDGNGAGHPNGPEGKFAKLAGQSPVYVLKQIQDFRSGARKHDQMAIMARSISDEDARDIAAYFSSLPRMKGEGGAAPAQAQALYDKGDAARGIAACINCHGAQGKGLAAMPLAPVIGGQEWLYLQKQLLDWRSGFRRNDPSGVMSQSTQALTDAEVLALTHYLSGL